MSLHDPYKQNVYLCRHGETIWTLSGQHTSFTDLPLTENGRHQSSLLAKELNGHPFATVFVSPSQRALATCELAVHIKTPVVDPDLAEWNYGDYEGMTTPEIRALVPGWSIFTHGAPGGESIKQVGERADRVIAKIRKADGDVAIFSSGHFSRVLAARWLGLPVETGRHFQLFIASLSILAYERETPAIRLWNQKID